MEVSDVPGMVTELDDGTGALTGVLEGTAITLAYDGERLSGNAGCNNYFGPATLTGETRIGPLASTMMMCTSPDGVMDQERRFLDLLAGADSSDLGDGRLELGTGGRVTIVMVPTSTDLAGSWSLLFYKDGNALVSPVPGTAITIELEEGRIQGNAGCNRYHASCQIEGSSLHISPPASTRMTCPGPEGVMGQEARYLELLKEVDSFDISRIRLLDLYDAEGRRILQFARS
jgi:heat shock protein HslJ